MKCNVRLLILTPLALFLSILPSFAKAELPYSLIILEGKSITNFALPKECYENQRRFINVSAKFYNGTDDKSIHGFENYSQEITLSNNNNKVIPVIFAAQKGTASILQVFAGKRVFCELSVNTPNDENLQKILDPSGILIKNIIQSGEGWYFFDLRKSFSQDNREAPSIGEGQIVPEVQTNNITTLSTNPDAGSYADISENGTVTYPKFSFVCNRPYIPGTGWGSGQARWAAGRPKRDGFSLKGENTSSNATSSLRCPKSVGETDYAIDGVYRLIWAVFPIKVPDHCTFLREERNNLVVSSCCCNGAVTMMTGRGCQSIDARNFIDWPDWGRSCVNS